jgi:hypothetical protein
VPPSALRKSLNGVGRAGGPALPYRRRGALLTVTVAVALAVWLPVRRASRVYPAEALWAD